MQERLDQDPECSLGADWANFSPKWLEQFEKDMSHLLHDPTPRTAVDAKQDELKLKMLEMLGAWFLAVDSSAELWCRGRENSRKESAARGALPNPSGSWRVVNDWFGPFCR